MIGRNHAPVFHGLVTGCALPSAGDRMDH